MSRAALKLRAICLDNGIPFAELARAAGMTPTTFAYYYTANGYKGRHLPRDELWSKPLQRKLLERGIPPETVFALFGIDAEPELADIRNTLIAINEQLKTLHQDVGEIRRTLNLPER